jgi:hypothetical protein
MLMVGGWSLGTCCSVALPPLPPPSPPSTPNLPPATELIRPCLHLYLRPISRNPFGNYSHAVNLAATQSVMIVHKAYTHSTQCVRGRALSLSLYNILPPGLNSASFIKESLCVQSREDTVLPPQRYDGSQLRRGPGHGWSLWSFIPVPSNHQPTTVNHS